MKTLQQKLNEAAKLHNKGFNCAQAVAMPFAKEFDLDPAFIARAMEGFGAGMGGRTEACGALSGVIFLAGLKNSDGNLDAPASKQTTYKISADICEKFKKECGSTVCKDIKSINARSCNECIEYGIRLATELLK